MWNKLTELDREMLFSYMSNEKELNLFIYGDIENYGVDSKNVSTFALYKDAKIDAIVVRFIHNYVVYSDHEDFNAKDVATFLRKEKGIGGITGKGEVIEKLLPYFGDYEFSKDTMLSLHKKDLKTSSLPTGFHFAEVSSKEETMKAALLLLNIEEFALSYKGINFESKKRKAIDGLKKENGHYNLAIYKDKELVSLASLTAKTKEAAMVVGVATKEAYRHLGLASSLISHLGEIAFNEMKLDYLCLFYNNPEAGSIYGKAGSKVVGPYDMLLKCD